MEVVTLDLGKNSYSINIGSGLLDNGPLIRNTISGNKVFVVTSETVACLYLERLEQALGGLEVDAIRLPDGEQFKNLETLERIVGELLANKHNRGTTIVALGGGVVGDVAGFAAATYQRGVDFIQIPTTLLSQVDSSVGGKTAVNHRLGKNMIGAFHQPNAVYIDIDVLKTLPPRELSAGLAEVIKHGILADVELFDWLEIHVDELLNLDEPAITHVIKRSCEIKANIVSIDETERGVRALLNLGHTFGHAIETNQGYGNWLHGEAVATGLVLAADLSMRTGRISPDDARRIRRLVEKFKLPVCPPPDMSATQFAELMKVDKKATDAGIRLVLIESIGRAVIVDDIEMSILEVTLESGDRLCEPI